MFLVSLVFMYGIISEDYLTMGVGFLVSCLLNHKNNTNILLICLLILVTFYKKYFFDVARYELLQDTRYTFQLLNIFNICPCELYGGEKNFLKDYTQQLPLLLYLPPIFFIASYKFLSLCK